MFSLSRTTISSVILVVLTASASLGLHAQSSSSSTPQPEQSAQPAAQTPTQSSKSVQARIRARREQRRATAINDVYSHLYEVYFGAGYLRFLPGNGAVAGKGLQHLNEYSWDVGATRYYSQRLGITLDGRGTYGTAFVGPNAVTNSAITNPAISQYSAMIGPTYRFLLHPRYSISGRVLAGGAYGNFSGDLGTFTPAQLGLYSNGAAVAFSASVPFEYNLSSEIGLRVAPEYLLTNFGGTIQNNRGFTGGVVVRWGKQ
jgi:hypothetical protein